MDRGAWQATVHGLAVSIPVSQLIPPPFPPLRGNHKFVFYFCDSISPLKISIVTTAGLLPGESPWREEPGGLESMRSQRIGHDSATKQRSTAQSVSLTLELLGTYMLNCCHLLLLVQE